MSTENAAVVPENTGLVAQPAQQQGGILSVPSNMQLPAYLQQQREQGHVAVGTETLKDYYVPPRFKIIQAQTKEELKDMYGEGSAIVVPSNVPIAPYHDELKRGAPFTFIPVFTFTSFGIVNPRNVKDPETGNDLPFLRESTYDYQSDIAKRAKNYKDKEARYAPCPESKDSTKKLRYVEFLNFICIVENVPDLYMMPVHFSFWSTGHADGRNLANLVLSRTGIDMFAQRFQGTVTPRKNSEGQWKGLTVQVPLEAPAFVQNEAEYNTLRKKHEEIKEMFKANAMRFEYDDDTSGDRTVDAEAAVAASNGEY